MKMSRLMNETLREVPAATEVKGHELLLRAGFVRQVAAGVFSYLHLGQRTLQKLEAIMRQEMNALGGQEIKMPLVHPAVLWQASGRWYEIDAELGRLVDRNGRSLTLALSHEETLAELARQEIHSYRQLPQMAYHIQTKWRDDPRPRAGLIRGREFTMLDSYSLDTDDAGLDEQYQAHFAAYFRIFARVGLPVLAVEADVGMMGGTMAHEFMYLTPIGEDTLLLCNACGYQANRQVATFRKPEKMRGTEAATFVAEIVQGEETVEQVVTAVFPAGSQVNETKLVHLLDAQRLRLAAGQGSGWWILDDGIDPKVWGTKVDKVGDITAAQEGDACATCGELLRTTRAVEVANIFKLGTRYSSTMNATFVDEQNQARPIVMGCYGIGVTRLLACLAEHHQDQVGLVWPVAIAPYQVHLLALRGGVETAVALHQNLRQAGVEVLFDDRDVRPGVKFNDADLIGLPLRLTVSQRSLTAGGVEVKERIGSETAVVAEDDLLNYITNWLAG
ncbi:aminoacyl--tRNA ligase-related protein [Candidatus Leptofilum sp.]|uniref:aminoacyl--tRNA ligase-related protein n=1 Tax=Candidatus Leptofilum sp. TaxID=3241576 RepID=UPI003B59FD66